jgi:DNA-binding beta-propeller fold protein YncE
MYGAMLAAGAGMAAPASAVALKEIFSLGGGAFPQDHIYRIDLSAGTVTDLGSGGVGFPTNLAMSPDRTLYYMNPFDSGGHSLYKATLDVTNTMLVGAPTFVKLLPTAGFGIIDGFTVGPNGDLYMTGYGKSEIYRYDVANDVFSIEVHLVPPPTGGPAGEFRSDLAFDPVTGDLVGLGIEPGTGDRTLFQVALGDLTDGVDNGVVWDYYGAPGSAWETKVLNSGSELGGNPDGIAFDPTNGALYMSGDGTGIYAYDRTTAVRGALIPGTGDGFLNGLGYDLAFQTREAPIPEPGTLALLLAGAGVLGGNRRRRGG